MQNLVTENPEKIYQMSLFQGGGRGSSMIPKCPNFLCPNQGGEGGGLSRLGQCLKISSFFFGEPSLNHLIGQFMFQNKLFQARIKKIMQSDEDVGKVAAPVPVIISRALELFSETLLLRAKKVTSQRGARTLTPSHL